MLLSVGYAACHWCHVMAHESFEDDATAAYMNEHFVNIKVDREERPDVDAVYMQATTAMTGQGGWPMTVVLTPEGEPFFAGTYFPDRPRHGQPSFRQVLEALTSAWPDRRDEVAAVAGDVSQHLRSQAMPAGDRRSTRTCSRARAHPGRRLRRGQRRLRRRARSSRPRWCWSSCCATAAARRVRSRRSTWPPRR